MDSANSGSIQSSSGGDEEYDSRAAADSFSPFLNTLHGGGALHQQQPPPPPPPLSHQLFPNLHHQSLFDPLSNYFDHHVASRPPPQGPSLRPEPGYTQIGSLSPLLNPHTYSENATRPTSPIPARNPKKRSRASRRAPTTVLTTDTTNFRAMVQEFTGIPAPPFSSSSPFPRTRLDLFGSHSTLRSGNMDTPYLLRPFAQKLTQPQPQPQPPPPPPPPFVPSTSSTITTTNMTNTSNSLSTAINYHQLPSDLALLNPILTFQSLLQHPPKYPLHNSTIETLQTHDSRLKMGSFDDFTLSQNQNQNHGHGAADIGNTVPLGSYKVQNYAASSSSDLRGGDKGSSDNVSARGEGMVESWICSSD